MTIPSAKTNSADEGLADLIDQILDKQQAGDPVDWDAIAEAHPDCAGQLREMRSVVELLGQLSQVESHDHHVWPPPVADAAGEPSLPGSLGTLGDFRLVREIGRGGMGVVYEAEQISLRRRVALKILPFAAVLDQRRLARFKNEACAGASLDHPNIIRVHTVGCEHGVHYYVMQFVEGPTVARVIAECRSLAGLDGATESRDVGAAAAAGLISAPFSFPNSLPEANPDDEPPVPAPGSTRAAGNGQATKTAAPASVPVSPEGPAAGADFFHSVAALGVQAADALEHAHRMGVVHRDIKPSNLLVTGGGHLLVADFGLAMTAAGADLTVTGHLLGTLRYMSPEQVQGNRDDLDHRTDIYSLGLTLYEMLTLRPAYGTDDPQRLLRQIVETEPSPPRHLNSAIPVDLETIVLKAIAKDPEARYATARELSDDLTRFLESRPVRARRPSLPDRARKWLQQHPLAVSSATSAMVIAVAAAAAAKWAHLQPPGVSVVLLLFAAVIGWLWHRRRVALVRAVEPRLAAARALLKSGDHASAGQQLAEAQRRLDAAGCRKGSLPRLVAGLREEVRAKSHARDLFDRFQQLRARVHSTMHHTHAEIRKRAEETCRAALHLYKVLEDADWKEQPDYQNLDHPRRKRLSEGVAELLFLLARLHMTDAGDAPERIPAYGRALEMLQRIETCHRSVPAVTLWISRCRSVLGQEETAGSYQATPTTALDYYVLGEYHSFQGQYQEAIESYGRALDREPNHCLSLLAAGLAWKKLGRHELAEGMFTAVIALIPQVDFAYIERGACRLAQGKADLAQLDFSKAGTTPVLNCRRHLEQAQLVQQAGNLPGALALLDKAADANPYSFTTYALRGRAFMDACRFDEAEADFSRAIDILGALAERRGPGSLPSSATVDESPTGQLVLAFHQRALARAHLDRLDDALEDVEQASRYIPDGGPDLLVQQAWFLLTCPDARLRNPQRAVALAEEAVRLSPTDGDAWNVLGVARYRVDKWNGAILAAGKSAKLRSGGDACDWYVLALSHGRLGQRLQAKRWYRKAAQATGTSRAPAGAIRQLSDEATRLLGPRNALVGAAAYQCKWCGAERPPRRTTCPRCGSPYFIVSRGTGASLRRKRVLSAIGVGLLLAIPSCTAMMAAPSVSKWLADEDDTFLTARGQDNDHRAGRTRRYKEKEVTSAGGGGSDGGGGGSDGGGGGGDGGGGGGGGGGGMGAPEPSTAVLTLLGAGGLAAYGSRQRRKWRRR